ncbi:MAG: methyltransferase domain-containing protein [Candidatus Thiodiazotropha sp.]
MNGNDLQNLREKWDKRHADADKRPTPAEVLERNLHLLPAQGLALDLACGLGGNALTLARHGLDVVAWDISPVAIQRLNACAAEEGLTNLTGEVRDVEQSSPPRNHFDLIIVSYYLERALIPDLVDALRSGGLLYYQTFIQAAVSATGPQNPAFRLADNELLNLFSSLQLRYYREENRLGNLDQGTRDVAMLVAQKP